MWQKIERVIVYGLIFAAPFQIRQIEKIWELPGKGFNEWSAAFLYGTDLLILALLVRWAGRTEWRFSFKTRDLFLVALVMFSSLSLIKADQLGLGFYRLVKILEFIGLYYYFAFSFGKIIAFPKILIVIMWSALFQGVVGIIQAMAQRSLGWWWLGESVLRTNFNGVAVIPWEGGRWLRAYGTTPHPNILAAWLFVAVFVFYFWYLYTKKERGWWNIPVLYLPLLFGLFFTFSRTAVGIWFLGIAALLVTVLIKRDHYSIGAEFKKRLVTLSLLTGMAMAVFMVGFWPQVQSRLHFSLQEQAITQRVFYNHLAGTVAREHPWSGIGVGQWVWKMMQDLPTYPAYFYQPVHNVYLLVLSEIGWPGFVAFVGFLIFLFRDYLAKTKLSELFYLFFFILSISVLLMGLFDHWLWTSQQGQILLWMLLSLVAALSSDRQKVIY